MSKIAIVYEITEEVRRAELGAGRDASEKRRIDVASTPALAALARLLNDGTGVIDASDPCFRWGKADCVLDRENAEAWVLQSHAQQQKALADVRAKREEEEARERERVAEAEQREDARLDAEGLDLVDTLDRRGEPTYSWQGTYRRHPDALQRARAALTEREACQAARVERDKAVAREYVLAHVPEYSRAASEGCDVRHVASDHVRGYLATLGAIKTYSDDPHKCPSAKAYAALDEIKATLSKSLMFTTASSPAPVDVFGDTEISITRADISRKETRIRTCIRIQASLPWGDEIDRSVIAEDETSEDENED